MAHYALLNEDNIVLQVLCVDNQFILDENGNEIEEIAIQKCIEGLNDPNAILVKTSYNANIRSKYAQIGDIYDENLDVFISPKPFPSWILDTNTAKWVAPVPMPENEPENGYYFWSEDVQNWVIENYPPKQITSESFRSQLTLTEKLLWDSPDTASTLSQKTVITTFKTELSLTEGTEELNKLLDLLVSEGVFTQQRLDEITSAI